MYHRPTNGLTFTLTQILEPTKYGDDNEKFGTGVAITPDAKFIAIGSPSALQMSKQSMLSIQIPRLSKK